MIWPLREGADGKLEEDQAAYEAALKAPATEQAVDANLPERSLGPEKAPELYHLEQDPQEARNLAADHPGQIEHMVAQWESWFRRVAAEWPAIYRENCRGE